MHQPFSFVRVLKSCLMLAFGGVNSGIYKFLLLLHILGAIVGLGGVMLNGLYAAQTRKRPGPTGRAVLEANLFVSEIATYVIYSIAISGILLVAASDGAWKFSQTWLWLSLLLYVIAIGVSHAVMRPGTKRIHDLMIEMEQGPPPAGGAPPQVAQIQEIGQRLRIGGAALSIIVVLILFLMVWKPGA
jgi:uncharacterized membrane protein